MTQRITTVLFAVCLCGALQAHAQDGSQVPETQKQEQRTQTLEPVVVTAGRIEEKARDVTGFVTVIPQEEIRKNQYQDIGGLLRNHGIQIDSYNNNSHLSQISIRGVRSSTMGSDLQGSVLIMVDGRRIGTDNIAMIPMVNIERVEIMRGPAAVQYGTSAIGGVVNVITKRGTEHLSASAEGGMGSWESYRGQGSIAWAKGPFDFSGGISYMGAGDYFIGGNNIHKYRNTAMDGKTAYSLNAGFNFLEEHRIGVTILGVNAANMGSPGYYNDIDRKSFTNRSNYSADFLYEGGYKDLGLSWKGRYFFGKSEHTNDAKHPRDYFDPWGFGQEEVRMSQLYYNTVNDYQGSQGQLTFQKSFLTITGGLDWLHYRTRSTTEMTDYSVWWLSQAPTIMESTRNTYENVGLFMLAKVALCDDRLIVSGGIRYDEYWLKADKKRKLNKTTPSFGIAFHATDWLTLKGNYGEAYRIPNAAELAGFKGGMYPIAANSNLKPEEARSYDAGFEIKHKSLYVSLGYFETEYKNKIVTDSTVVWPDPTRYVNHDGKIWLKGFEGRASYDIGEAFDWPVKVRPYVNFTALTERSASQGINNAKFGNRVPNVSDLEMGYGLNFTYPDIGFEADLRFTYIGRQYVQDWNDKNLTYNQVVRVGGKTVADLFLRQKVYASDKAGTLSVFGEVRNITNERYALIKDYPQPGRSFFLGLRYDY